MSESLAAELLADFDDENDEQISEDEAEQKVGGLPKANDAGMELDGDEEEDDGEDADMGGMPSSAASDLDADDDTEARKSKIEKLQLAGIEDVRSVAGLMKILEPVLEVRAFLTLRTHSLSA